MTADDTYDRLLQLADSFGATGGRLREWARLGAEILRDDDVTDSAPLAPKTWEAAEAELRLATSGHHGLLHAGLELDADALAVRATVLTYQWIDELQAAATAAFGDIAGRAIGYLAPEVELGGALVSAGLIETDPLDRDGVSGYLSELAADHPELMEHVAGGGSLLESLQLRTLLTAPSIADRPGAIAAGGLRRLGLASFDTGPTHALRDIAVDLLGEVGEVDDDTRPAVPASEVPAPRSLTEMMTTLAEVSAPVVTVHRTGAGRYLAYLPGPAGANPRRLISGDLTTYVDAAAHMLERAVERGAKLALIGDGAGGTAATSLAAGPPSDSFTIEHVITAGAPAAAAARVPESTRVLSLDDRTDPVALLGGLVNAGLPNRLSVVYDGSRAADERPYVAGARAADASPHPDLRAELERLRDRGYLLREPA